ncbi:sulfatase [Aureimonas endophytica]|uniref:Sulfatase n=1 Tax=Aureimonas endophytica TaxID=2027858 RepID=A0A917E5G7_9HYPH|nr:alkaline phosphatase family protein [Aureimonas endophytica]GGE04895.1 sulfatase [Aureimonas endophytica]
MSSRSETKADPGGGFDILFVTADQWRADHGPGRAPVALPNVEALARDGVIFENHFTQAYPCGPARAGLHTGLYPHKHRSILNGTPLDARHPTVFSEARRAGYRPRLFGYTDTTADPRALAPGDPARGDYEGLAPGIEVDTLLTERAVPWLAHLKKRGHDVSRPEEGREAIFGQAPFGAPAVFQAEESETAFLTDRFLDWLSVAGPEPFFVHLSFIAPHPPFAVAEPFHSLVDPADVALPIGWGDFAREGAQHPLIAFHQGQVDLSRFAPSLSGQIVAADERLVRRLRATYAGMAAEVDHHLGRIVAALKAAGRWDRTLIVLSGDHGEQLFDHGLLGKLGYFDQSAHIPLILRDPRPAARSARGTRVSAFTQSIDVLPTILDLIGLQPPPNVDGRSLLPFCRGERPADWRDAAFWSFDFRDPAGGGTERHFGLPPNRLSLHVVRTDRLKYVHFAGLPPVLIDLAEDPEERINRSRDPASAPLRLEGLERLLELRLTHEDDTLTA